MEWCQRGAWRTRRRSPIPAGVQVVADAASGLLLNDEQQSSCDMFTESMAGG